MSHTPRRLQFAVLSAALTSPLLAHATAASDALQALTAQDWVTRSVSLKDLGITNPVVLDQADNRQAFFLPVPKGVAISEAQIELKGQFIKGEEQPATLRLAVDGQPRVAERVNRAEGDLGRTWPWIVASMPAASSVSPWTGVRRFLRISAPRHGLQPTC